MKAPPRAKSADVGCRVALEAKVIVVSFIGVVVSFLASQLPRKLRATGFAETKRPNDRMAATDKAKQTLLDISLQDLGSEKLDKSV